MCVAVCCAMRVGARRFLRVCCLLFGIVVDCLCCSLRVVGWLLVVVLLHVVIVPVLFLV